MWQISDRFSVSSPGVLEGFDAGVVENVRKLHYLYSWHITGNVGECPATSQATIMVLAWRGPSTHYPWCQRIPEQFFFPIIGWRGVIQYSGYHVLPISLLWISLSGGEMKYLVYETPIDTPEELVARVAEAAAIILETQSFTRRCCALM